MPDKGAVIGSAVGGSVAASVVFPPAAPLFLAAGAGVAMACAFGAMGCDDSKTIVNNMITNKIVNKNVIEVANNNIAKLITKSTVENISKSSASCSNISDVDIGDINIKNSKVAGLYDIDIDQECEISMSAESITQQTNVINASVAQMLFSSIAGQIEASQLNDIVSQAESNASQGFTPIPPPSVSSEVNLTVNNEMQNIAERKFANNIANIINNNTDSLNFGECFTNALNISNIQHGGADISGSIIRGALVKIKVKQVSKIIQECIFNTLQSSQVVTKVLNTIGIKVEDKLVAESAVTAKVSAKSTTTSLGLESMFTSMNIFIGVIIFIICCLIVVGVIMAMKSSGAADKDLDIPQGIERSGLGLFMPQSKAKKAGDGDDDDESQAGGYRKTNLVTKALLFLASL